MYHFWSLEVDQKGVHIDQFTFLAMKMFSLLVSASFRDDVKVQYGFYPFFIFGQI